MKLLLFDIDGVIVELQDGHGPIGHRYAARKAIEDVYGIDYTPKLDHMGMTDKNIIYEELRLHGLSEEEITAKLQDCIKLMNDIFKNYDNSNLVAVDGIKELLEKLNQNKNVLIGLLTGNMEEIAYEKMIILGLRDYFKVGGFGSDKHEKRSDLVKVARGKAERLGYKIDDVFVIGDTPRDIQTGKESDEANVKTVAVATGNTSMEELKKHNPDYLFEKLEADSFVEAINN